MSDTSPKAIAPDRDLSTQDIKDAFVERSKLVKVGTVALDLALKSRDYRGSTMQPLGERLMDKDSADEILWMASNEGIDLDAYQKRRRKERNTNVEVKK